MSIIDRLGKALINTLGDMVETIYYTPSGGTELELSAQVFRDKDNQENIRGGTRNVAGIRIFIRKDATYGVESVIVNEDVVKVKLDQHDTEYATRRVRKILNQDTGGFVLAIA